MITFKVRALNADVELLKEEALRDRPLEARVDMQIRELPWAIARGRRRRPGGDGGGHGRVTIITVGVYLAGSSFALRKT
jgi:hypothetical protein